MTKKILFSILVVFTLAFKLYGKESPKRNKTAKDSSMTIEQKFAAIKELQNAFRNKTKGIAARLEKQETKMKDPQETNLQEEITKSIQITDLDSPKVEEESKEEKQEEEIAEEVLLDVLEQEIETLNQEDAENLLGDIEIPEKKLSAKEKGGLFFSLPFKTKIEIIKNHIKAHKVAWGLGSVTTATISTLLIYYLCKK